MKKLIALLLAAVACLTLGACGGGEDPVNEKEAMIVGQWQFDDGRCLTFRADHTGSILAEETCAFCWTYDEELGGYPCTVTESGERFVIGYIIQDGIVTLHCGGSSGTKTDNG